MKNVWILNEYATPPKYGSIVRHHNLAKYMDKDKYNVYIIASSAIHNSDINLIETKELYKISNIDGINYIHIKTSQYKGNGIKRIINILQFFFNTKRARKKLVNDIGKPDIIYASSPMPTTALLGIDLAKKMKVQNSIIEVRDLWPDSVVSFGVASKRNILVKILYWIEKIMYLKADKLVFTRQGGKEYISTKKYKDKIDYSKIYNINNGVDIEQYKYNESHYTIDDEELNDKNTFKLLYTGGIRKSYNIKQILELAQKIQENNFENVKIFLYGNGNEKQEMIEYCKQNHIKNVVFRDFIDNKYIPDIMSKCDICLLHGKNVEIFKYGTSQNKMFAYLYSGKPIISSFYNKYDLIEKNGCGITLKNNTLEEYYEAFVKIYNTYNEKKYEYQKNERNLLEQFDYETLAKQLEKIIE